MKNGEFEVRVNLNFELILTAGRSEKLGNMYFYKIISRQRGFFLIYTENQPYNYFFLSRQLGKFWFLVFQGVILNWGSQVDH